MFETMKEKLKNTLIITLFCVGVAGFFYIGAFGLLNPDMTDRRIALETWKIQILTAAAFAAAFYSYRK